MTIPPVLLKGDELLSADTALDPYDNSRELSRYLLMHYGEFSDMFDRVSHPLAPAHGYPHRLSRLLESCARSTGTAVTSVLDAGCGVGGVSQALAGWVPGRVLGIDVSARSVELAQSVARHGGGSFAVAQTGPFVKEIHIRLPPARAEIEFEVGDAAAIRPGRTPFDAVVLSNVLDRVDDPAACLDQFAASARILRPGGLLLVACPWSWYPEYGPSESWLGSGPNRTPSDEAVKAHLATAFDLLAERDEPAVLRQNPREYDYFEAHVTVWRKRV